MTKASALSRGAATAFTERTLAGSHALNPSLNAFTATTDLRARTVGARAEVGGGSPLAGTPYAVKNPLDLAGMPALADSAIRCKGAPAAEDAVLVQPMRATVTVLVAMTNVDEFAYGFSTENSYYGPTRNPHDTTRIGGGSSSGVPCWEEGKYRL